MENIKTLILRAVNDKTDGMGIYNGVIDDDAVMFLAEISNGDARNSVKCSRAWYFDYRSGTGWQDTYYIGSSTAMCSEESIKI